MPIKTRIFQDNPTSALNYHIPEIAKKEKTPIEIIEDRYAKGELSDIEYQNKIRLLKLRKQVLNENEKQNEHRKKVRLN